MQIQTTTICVGCMYYRPSGDLIPSCAAFPEGIPERYLSGRKEHREPDPEDNGIQYRSMADVRTSESVRNMRSLRSNQ